MNAGLFIVLAALMAYPLPGMCQRQGIRGEVFWLSGNQMPGPNRDMAPGFGIKREVCIYEVATREQADQQDVFFSNVRTRLVATVTSDSNGRFKVKLPPGKYSVFVKEPQGLFANLFSTTGEINPVVVEPKKFTWVSITVDYEAAY
ncbi:MAG TPA: carboxypeptidase-like regulatory domain-containing protein [Cyclobacteriaceae bacterium]